MVFTQSLPGTFSMNPAVGRACAQGETVLPAKQGIAGRRQVLAELGLFTVSVFSTDISLAAQAPKGYQVVLDKFDGYSFIYPFGWQEVVVKGQDKAYKDVIEPLESISVSIVPTNKMDVHELGPPEEVAETLVRKVLSPPSQKTQLINAKEPQSFAGLKLPQLFTHLACRNSQSWKFYTLTIGANERRWSKMEDKLRTAVDSFTIYNV